MTAREKVVPAWAGAGFHTISTNIAATAPTNTQPDTAIVPGNARFYRVGVEQ